LPPWNSHFNGEDDVQLAAPGWDPTWGGTRKIWEKHLQLVFLIRFPMKIAKILGIVYRKNYKNFSRNRAFILLIYSIISAVSPHYISCIVGYSSCLNTPKEHVVASISH
jgi:hypothetical protein